MFRALLAHLQDALHKQQLVYCLRVVSDGCYLDWSSTPIQVAAIRHKTHPIHVYQLLFMQRLLKMSK
jgi:hypothetical protein